MIIKKIIWLLLLSLVPLAAGNLDTIIRQTQERLDKEAFSYGANVTMGGSPFYVERTVKQDNAFSIVYSVENDGSKSELMKLLEKDGFWYLMEPPHEKYIKYRQHEAVPRMPIYYLLRNFSEIYFSVKRDLTWKQGEETKAYHIPLNEKSRQSIAAFLKNYEEFKGRPGYEETRRDLQDRIDKGYKHRVDLRTGLLIEQNNDKCHIKISDFKWLGKDYVIEETPGELQSDCSGPKDYRNLVLVRHSPIWTPQTKLKLDGMAVLLNCKTGKTVRVPYIGSVCMPGSLSADRKTVYATGVNVAGGLEIYSINLETGENVQHTESHLGKADLMPKISPDGKMLIYKQMRSSASGLVDDINLINLKSNTLHTLIAGTKSSGTLTWSYDSKGFFFQSGLETPAVCYYSLVGKVTKIISGGRFPLVLSKDRILYKMNGKMMTADYSGKDIKPFHLDTFKYFDFRSNSVDSTLLMMKKDFVKGNKPCIWKPGDKEPRIITEEKGLWYAPEL